MVKTACFLFEDLKLLFITAKVQKTKLIEEFGKTRAWGVMDTFYLKISNDIRYALQEHNLHRATRRKKPHKKQTGRNITQTGVTEEKNSDHSNLETNYTGVRL